MQVIPPAPLFSQLTHYGEDEGNYDDDVDGCYSHFIDDETEAQ